VPGHRAVELDDARVLGSLDRAADEPAGAGAGQRGADRTLEDPAGEGDRVLEALEALRVGGILVPRRVEGVDEVAGVRGPDAVVQRLREREAGVDRVDALHEEAVDVRRRPLVATAQRRAVVAPDQAEGGVGDAGPARARAALLVVVEVARRRVGPQADVDAHVAGGDEVAVAGAHDLETGLGAAQGGDREDVVGVEAAVVGGDLHRTHRRTSSARGRVRAEGEPVALGVAGAEVARSVVGVHRVGDVGSGLTGSGVEGVGVLDDEVGGALPGRKPVRPAGGADHDLAAAEGQLGVGHGAVLGGVDGGALEAERTLEELDAGGGVSVDEDGEDGLGHERDRTARLRQGLGRMGTPSGGDPGAAREPCAQQPGRRRARERPEVAVEVRLVGVAARRGDARKATFAVAQQHVGRTPEAQQARVGLRRQPDRPRRSGR
jgi:hypothetical protein